MPRQAIEDIGERVARLTPEAGLQFWAEQRDAAQVARFDAWIEELSKFEVKPGGEAPDLEKIVAPVVDGFGRAMQADRVVFYADLSCGKRSGTFAPASHSSAGSPKHEGHSLLEPVALWNRTDEGPDQIELVPRLRLDASEGCERDLRAGFAHRISGLTGLVASPSAPSGTRRWAPVRTTLLVPCSTGGQLLGVFALEASLGAARWRTPIVGRAEFAGRLFANLLDRVRLARQVQVLQSREAQGDRLAALGQAASGVAHDFNNVLTAILGYADLLEIELGEGDGGQRGHQELDEIRAAATRATRLVDHVLSFGRVREGGSQPVDLDQALEGLEGMLRRVVGNGVRVECDWAGGAEVDAAGDVEVDTAGDVPKEDPVKPLVLLDPEQLERVVLNLAANARDAFSEPKDAARFDLSTRLVRIDGTGREASKSGGLSPAPSAAPPGLAPGRYVRLTARDNGCGIDPALFERLFEPFFTTKPEHGTGLGLAICAEFVRDAGGEIRVESAPGRGSAFHLYFPLVEAPSVPVIPRAGFVRKDVCGRTAAFDTTSL